MAYTIVCTAEDFVNFFKYIPQHHGSIYNNTFPRNCLYNVALNVWSADCWNMIKAALWNDLVMPTPIGSYSYQPGKYGLQDLNGYQIIQACSDVSSDFTNLTPGEYLSTSGYDHAGVYVGEVTDGTNYWNVVECTPIWANGIQFSWVDPDGTRRQKKGGAVSVYWAKHGKLPWVDYSEDPPEPPTPPEPDPPEPPVPSPEVPTKNINVFVVDKGLKKITVIRDNAPTQDEKTLSVDSSVNSVLISFEAES